MKRLFCVMCLGALTITLQGCLTPQTAAPADQFLLHAPVEVQPAERIPVTLGFRALDAARPYQLFMAHTDADGRLNFYQTATWAEYPAMAITRLLRDAVLRTGRFADAGMAERMARPDWMLVGYLDAFHEDRSTTPPQAVVQVRFELRRARETDMLWAVTLREVEPLDGTGPGALAAAMDKAVARVIGQAAAQLATVAP